MRRRERGATLVEVLVAIALAAVLLPTLATAFVTAYAGRASSQQQLKATAVLHQANEAVRALRTQDWSNIATNGVYHPVVSGSGWALASGAGTADGFTTEVTVSTANRDGSGDITLGGGTADPSTKHIETSVSWTTPYDGSLVSDMYLSRWQNSAVWTTTSEADFTSGTTSDTVVTNLSGGEVTLDGAPSYQTSGTFESASFDAGGSASFNYLFFTADQPAGTAVTFQIATNNDNSTWNYIGPSGDGSSYFSLDARIPLNATDGRYIRFKAFLSGDGSSTPTLQDMQIGYSR